MFNQRRFDVGVNNPGKNYTYQFQTGDPNNGNFYTKKVVKYNYSNGNQIDSKTGSTFSTFSHSH